MNKTFRILGWTYFFIMLIATLPVGLIIFSVCSNITFTGDKEPKIMQYLMYVLAWPLILTETKKDIDEGNI